MEVIKNLVGIYKLELQMHKLKFYKNLDTFIVFIKLKKNFGNHNRAFAGNRTRGICLEGKYVTTTPQKPPSPGIEPGSPA